MFDAGLFLASLSEICLGPEDPPQQTLEGLLLQIFAFKAASAWTDLVDPRVNLDQASFSSAKLGHWLTGTH